MATALQQTTESKPVVWGESELEKLLQKNLNEEFHSLTDDARTTIEQSVHTLAEMALASSNAVVPDDALRTINAYIAELDKKLAEQINVILHHTEFQQLESAWRGLHYLITNTETDEKLKIRVMNISKDDLRRTLYNFRGTAWDQSPIARRIYEEEYGTFGGHPFAVLIGDYYFDHTAPDIELLRELSKTAAAAHAPFIAAAAPKLLQMESWQQLQDPRDLKKIFTTAEYASWRSLRTSSDAMYVGLTMPRFLARLPYGENNPVEEFAFEEITASEASAAEHKCFTWANSAYAMATNITRSFKESGWLTQIRGVASGGAVLNLPTHTFPTDDGGVDMKCPTEIAITDRRELELTNSGLMPLIHRKNEDFAAFFGAQSLVTPAEFQDKDATANAKLGANLPYVFACSRFAHYLKCMVRDKVGEFTSRQQLQDFLSKWIGQYIDPDPDYSTQEYKARHPLVAAEVQVAENEESPGYYQATFFLRPHYQLEGVNVSLRLVSKLPREKKR